MAWHGEIYGMNYWMIDKYES